MRDLYLWQVPYVNALVETDASVKELRIYEAIAAIEQRLLSPIAPGCYLKARCGTETFTPAQSRGT